MAVPPERMMLTAAQVEAHIGVALAGRAAEELIFGSACITSGAANDLQQATELTARMCMEWGMDADSGLAVRRVLTPWGGGGEALVRARLEKIYAMTKALLEENMGALRALAEALLREEWLGGEKAGAIVRAAMEKKTGGE